jgi:hypothetical protein
MEEQYCENKPYSDPGLMRFARFPSFCEKIVEIIASKIIAFILYIVYFYKLPTLIYGKQSWKLAKFKSL